ncbi:Homoserine/homoserine lactone efflux protein [Burkholderia pseudomultivorans]|uniref:Homoserine/homoserine lactone efflux protein n=1 Tax=Burkholderia pseudomultivorans TaxID=1207504 RepID=A0ABU2E821_9BURK|nr:Homoserine/homoserine lactone efflux protein [Burkholderia pseudomultivorans]MDR8733029.1 Homoserine/homoserine lactone efflux protein [Burkholderia pseudomultivorans]MDR8739896.1 Homoserine/homoserine lactone efflux protein [Burkholderia pseudomultivorans]MDR8756022.1 Homoserine/homoserine lactone efflux protein [Burkholderia pseudomultivorans]MDR8776002.1 Homoserine/homoserine lactone efflux protein [Burkholderia pseudomultivorans]
MSLSARTARSARWTRLQPKSIMDATSLLAFALALVVMSCTPGPSVAALIARVLTNGFRETLPFLAAMWLGEAVWLTCAIAGLAVIAHTFATGFFVLKMAGVGYLLFLAWKMWTAPADAPTDEIPRGRTGWRMFLAGSLVTAGNPKIALFYLALLPTIIDLRAVNTVGWAELVATMLAVLITADCTWAFVATRVRKLILTRRAIKIANRTSAAAMAGAAVAIATR